MPLYGSPNVNASRVLWGDPVEGEARALLAAAEVDHDSEARSMTDEAADWLRGRIADAGGEMDRRDVLADAKSAGFSERTIDRARPDAGVVVRQSGFGAEKRSLWRTAAGSIPPTRSDVGANDDAPNPATIPPIAPSADVGGNGAIGGAIDGEAPSVRDWQITRSSGESFTTRTTPRQRWSKCARCTPA